MLDQENRRTAWLRDAVVYEIYLQSFADSNGDGIGDLAGATARLDYLQWLGVDAVWLHPCFASPFVDAGYDVSDYLSVAPRYGTNDDLVAFMAAATDRGIRVLLDLVVGHTSVEHAWFQDESASPAADERGDRYIWSTPEQGDSGEVGVLGSQAWVPSPGRRPGRYLKNFFDAQPALNFGYARMRADEPWRQPIDAPGPTRNRRALREVMAFWLERGAAGFRVDMAFSLVKDDPGLKQNAALWRELRGWLDESFPDAVLVPEGVEPRTGRRPAFDADFFLVIGSEHSSLFNNGGAGRLPHLEPAPCYFDAEGQGSVATFVDGWNGVLSDRPDRLILMGSSDHDYSRLRCGTRDAEQLGAAFTFLMTWGTVPVVYYGDEIGLPYRPDLPDVEGSVCHPGFYNRAGARTPMQWDDGPNAGFSTASAAALYLPVDQHPGPVSVQSQVADPDSTAGLVRRLVALRRAHPALRAGGDARVVYADYPLVFSRGGGYLVVVNPGREPATAAIADLVDPTVLLGSGVRVVGDHVHAAGFGYAVLRRGAEGDLT